MVDHFAMIGASCGLEDFGPDPDSTPDPAIFVSDLQEVAKQ